MLLRFLDWQKQRSLTPLGTVLRTFSCFCCGCSFGMMLLLAGEGASNWEFDRRLKGPFVEATLEATSCLVKKFSFVTSSMIGTGLMKFLVELRLSFWVLVIVAFFGVLSPSSSFWCWMTTRWDLICGSYIR